MLPAEAGEMSVPSRVLAGIWGQQHALPYLPLGGIFHLMSIAPSTHTPSASSPVMWDMRRYYRHVNSPLSLSPQVYVSFPGPVIPCPERVYDDRGRECVYV
jgi:hypothetical protein